MVDMCGKVLSHEVTILAIIYNIVAFRNNILMWVEDIFSEWNFVQFQYKI